MDWQSEIIGKTISHYEVLEQLGKGPMGVVYKAYDTVLRRNVVLKFLPEEIRDDSAALLRFLREANAAASLNHKNICTIHELDRSTVTPFIVMEFLKGQTLRALIAANPFPNERVFDFAIQIATGLDFAHKNGIIHRDIKPANIFVTEDDTVKILDFGLAMTMKLAEPDNKQTAHDTTMRSTTEPGTIVGTPHYMSPEQAAGQDLDTRSDLFSMGSVLYEMCTGTLAFAGTSTQVVLHSVRIAEPIPPLKLNRDLHPKLADIIERLLQKDRTLRYQHASDLVSALRLVQTKWRRPPSERVKRGFRVAVLPLHNKTTDPDNDYLAEGISDSLITSLSYLPKLTVISRASSFRYASATADPVIVGRELDVAAIFMGTIVIKGEVLFASLELINTLDRARMWAERFECKLINLAGIEERIAQDVADRLPSKFTYSKRTATNPKFRGVSALLKRPLLLEQANH